MQHFEGKKAEIVQCVSKKMQEVFKYMKYTNFVVEVLVSYIYRMGTV